jgi:hypothetical protein
LRDLPLTPCVTLLSIFHPSSTAFSLVCLDIILASPRSPCLPTTQDVPSSNKPDRAGQPGTTRRKQMSPKGDKKSQKTAKTLRTSPVVDPQNLPICSPLDDGARSQMFNLSTPLRRRSRGLPLNPGLPEHTPKKRRVKEPVLSTEGHQFDPDLGSRIEHAVDDRHRQVMSAHAPLKERIEDRSAKGATNNGSAKGATYDESVKGATNDESANGASSDESAKGANNNESNEGSH